jgi:surface protein
MMLLKKGASADRFIISVKTDNAGTSANNQFTIPWIGTYDVDWGDGTSDSSVTNTQTHTYASAGTYDVKVTAASGRIRFNNGGDKSKLLDIRNWGACQWTSMESAFRGSGNLDNISAVDIINLTNCTSLQAMFRSSSVSQINTSNWDVSNITSLYQSFAFCSNIQSLDVSSWDVSNVTEMESLFRGITALNTLDVSSWDTSNVGISPSAARYVFQDSPNINPDISNWVLGGNNLDKMLEDADSFDRSLANWDISSTPNLRNFMQNATGMSISNYNATLISWASQNPTPTSCNFGGSQYTIGGAGETARNTLINTFGWTIVDGGGI